MSQIIKLQNGGTVKRGTFIKDGESHEITDSVINDMISYGKTLDDTIQPYFGDVISAMKNSKQGDKFEYDSLKNTFSSSAGLQFEGLSSEQQDITERQGTRGGNFLRSILRSKPDAAKRSIGALAGFEFKDTNNTGATVGETGETGDAGDAVLLEIGKAIKALQEKVGIKSTDTNTNVDTSIGADENVDADTTANTNTTTVDSEPEVVSINLGNNQSGKPMIATLSNGRYSIPNWTGGYRGFNEYSPLSEGHKYYGGWISDKGFLYTKSEVASDPEFKILISDIQNWLSESNYDYNNLKARYDVDPFWGETAPVLAQYDKNKNYIYDFNPYLAQLQGESKHPLFIADADRFYNVGTPGEQNIIAVRSGADDFGAPQYKYVVRGDNGEFQVLSEDAMEQFPKSHNPAAVTDQNISMFDIQNNQIQIPNDLLKSNTVGNYTIKSFGNESWLTYVDENNQVKYIKLTANDELSPNNLDTIIRSNRVKANYPMLPISNTSTTQVSWDKTGNKPFNKAILFNSHKKKLGGNIPLAAKGIKFTDSGVDSISNTIDAEAYNPEQSDVIKDNRTTIGDLDNGSWSDQLTAKDKLMIGAIAADMTGLGISFVPGANIASAATGLAGTVAAAVADAKDKEGFTWGDVGNALLGVGLDLATLVPVAGGSAKTAKILTKVARNANALSRVFSIAGIVDASSAVKKISEEGIKSLNTDDIRSLMNGLMAVVGGGRREIQRVKAINKGVKSTPTENIGGSIIRDKSGNEISLSSNDVAKIQNSTNPKAAAQEIIAAHLSKGSETPINASDVNLKSYDLTTKKWYAPFGKNHLKDLDIIKEDKFKAFKKFFWDSDNKTTWAKNDVTKVKKGITTQDAMQDPEFKARYDNIEAQKRANKAESDEKLKSDIDERKAQEKSNQDNSTEKSIVDPEFKAKYDEISTRQKAMQEAELKAKNDRIAELNASRTKDAELLNKKRDEAAARIQSLNKVDGNLTDSHKKIAFEAMSKIKNKLKGDSSKATELNDQLNVLSKIKVRKSWSNDRLKFEINKALNRKMFDENYSKQHIDKLLTKFDKENKGIIPDSEQGKLQSFFDAKNLPEFKKGGIIKMQNGNTVSTTDDIVVKGVRGLNSALKLRLPKQWSETPIISDNSELNDAVSHLRGDILNNITRPTLLEALNNPKVKSYNETLDKIQKEKEIKDIKKASKNIGSLKGRKIYGAKDFNFTLPDLKVDKVSALSALNLISHLKGNKNQERTVVDALNKAKTTGLASNPATKIGYRFNTSAPWLDAAYAKRVNDSVNLSSDPIANIIQRQNIAKTIADKRFENSVQMSQEYDKNRLMNDEESRKYAASAIQTENANKQYATNLDLKIADTKAGIEREKRASLDQYIKELQTKWSRNAAYDSQITGLNENLKQNQELKSELAAIPTTLSARYKAKYGKDLDMDKDSEWVANQPEVIAYKNKAASAAYTAKIAQLQALKTNPLISLKQKGGKLNDDVLKILKD